MLLFKIKVKFSLGVILFVFLVSFNSHAQESTEVISSDEIYGEIMQKIDRSLGSNAIEQQKAIEFKKAPEKSTPQKFERIIQKATSYLKGKSKNASSKEIQKIRDKMLQTQDVKPEENLGPTTESIVQKTAGAPVARKNMKSIQPRLPAVAPIKQIASAKEIGDAKIRIYRSLGTGAPTSKMVKDPTTGRWIAKVEKAVPYNFDRKTSASEIVAKMSPAEKAAIIDSNFNYIPSKKRGIVKAVQAFIQREKVNKSMLNSGIKPSSVGSKSHRSTSLPTISERYPGASKGAPDGWWRNKNFKTSKPIGSNERYSNGQFKGDFIKGDPNPRARGAGWDPSKQQSDGCATCRNSDGTPDYR